MTDRARETERGLWRRRGRRIVTGVNVLTAVALASVLFVMANFLAGRHYFRWDISSNAYYRLSERTERLIASLPADVEVVAFFRKSHPLFRDVNNLLKEYEYAASRHSPRRLHVQRVDPDRDLADARRLKQKYDLAEADTVLFACDGRTQHVPAVKIADYKVELTDGRAVRRRENFRGEQVFSSAIQSVIAARRPRVYILTGHGERAVDDFSRSDGFSGMARAMLHDNMELLPLRLTKDEGVPRDCSALVIAGPEQPFTGSELDMLDRYLSRSGRLLLMLDPGTESGLGALLSKWGVRIGNDVVMGLTLTGRELIVSQYGDHPITRSFKNVTTLLYRPRSVWPAEDTPLTDSGVSDDRPHVTVLAATGESGWSERNPEQRPIRFDPETDRRGPIPVAVAVEKGTISGIELEIKPTRLVVIGDSYFVSNGALESGVGGNTDFVLSAVNWLVEREALLAIGPKIPGELRLDMTRGRLQAAYLAIVGGFPLAIAVLGFAVWIRRRR